MRSLWLLQEDHRQYRARQRIRAKLEDSPKHNVSDILNYIKYELQASCPRILSHERLSCGLIDESGSLKEAVEGCSVWDDEPLMRIHCTNKLVAWPPVTEAVGTNNDVMFKKWLCKHTVHDRIVKWKVINVAVLNAICSSQDAEMHTLPHM